ncbi:MAG: FtsB family cell division protein [Bryobacteraceae bacterium]
MKPVLRSLVVAAGVLLAGTYAYIALRGPQGVPALLEKRREIRELEEQNQNLRAETQRKMERINRLRTSRAEQELEIRRRLKLQREGETSFYIPEAPDPEAEAPEAESGQ